MYPSQLLIKRLNPGLPDFSWYNKPKRGKIPNYHKFYQMAINYANAFHWKTLQNLPKFESFKNLDFWALYFRLELF
jgi:hypothetical protein